MGFPLRGRSPCDGPASKVKDGMPYCQAKAMDNLDGTPDAIDCYDTGEDGGLAKRVKEAMAHPWVCRIKPLQVLSRH